MRLFKYPLYKNFYEFKVSGCYKVHNNLIFFFGSGQIYWKAIEQGRIPFLRECSQDPPRHITRLYPLLQGRNRDL